MLFFFWESDKMKIENKLLEQQVNIQNSVSAIFSEHSSIESCVLKESTIDAILIEEILNQETQKLARKVNRIVEDRKRYRKILK